MINVSDVKAKAALQQEEERAAHRPLDGKTKSPICAEISETTSSSFLPLAF